jgi:hypothetical protein
VKAIETAWKPSEEELRLLKNGGVVTVTVLGGWLPVKLAVQPVTELADMRPEGERQ